MAGGIWFAEKLLAGDEDVRRAFIDALKAGGSDYAYRILLEAGWIWRTRSLTGLRCGG